MSDSKKKFKLSFTATVLLTVAFFVVIAYLLYPNPRKALKGKKSLVYWVVGNSKKEIPNTMFKSVQQLYVTL